jgi:hypothetical protein
VAIRIRYQRYKVEGGADRSAAMIAQFTVAFFGSDEDGDEDTVLYTIVRSRPLSDRIRIRILLVIILMIF